MTIDEQFDRMLADHDRYVSRRLAVSNWIRFGWLDQKVSIVYHPPLIQELLNLTIRAGNKRACPNYKLNKR